MPNLAPLPKIPVHARILAQLSGYTEKRIQQLDKLGLFPRMDGKQFDLCGSCAALFAHMKNQIVARESADAPDELKQERIRKLKIENFQAMGKLILKDDVKMTVAECCQDVQDVFSRYLPASDYNAAIKELKQKWKSRGSELLPE
jgi:hypothetical protein